MARPLTLTKAGAAGCSPIILWRTACVDSCSRSSFSRRLSSLVRRRPGPKPRKAAAARRQKNGNFKKVEELMNVKGIGEKSFLKLKPLITVTADKGDHASGQK